MSQDQSLDPDLLRRYAAARAKQDVIVAELKELSMEIVENFDAIGKTKQPTSLGTFSLASRKSWKYSPAIEEAEEVVEKMKGEEQQRGVAQYEETRYLKFSSVKE